MDFAPHFSRQELEHSDTAQAHGLDNTCPDELLENLAGTSQLAEQIRTALGCPLVVTSGYRSQALNDLVAKGASSTGVHPLGLAVDLVPCSKDLDVPGAFAALQAQPEIMRQIDQLIIERGCLHVGRPRPGQAPRHELRADKTIDGVRHYPMVGIWREGQVLHA